MSNRADLDARTVINPVRKNYDYGEGLYSGKMNKFKSVREYLKSKKSKKKKSFASLLEQIEEFSTKVSKLFNKNA
jgi:hypothetical protein